MEAIAVALFLSLAANRIIEALVRPLKKYLYGPEEFTWWWLIYVSWVFGGVLAWLAGLQLFQEYLPLYPLVDRILTAIVVGGGANLIHGIFGDN